jgi:glycosyltransferase involved in cell wall biosynthesis
LDWVGFVDSIEEVWTTAVAHLVAVPTPLGFRVRIAESLCRGVPVLSHPSAESGLPMLKHGENYLACSTPADWLDAVKRLESDAGLAALLAQNGRKAFDQHLSIVVGLERFGSLSEQAIKRFHNS